MHMIINQFWKGLLLCTACDWFPVFLTKFFGGFCNQTASQFSPFSLFLLNILSHIHQYNKIVQF